jgi:hypothetical protein
MWPGAGQHRSPSSPDACLATSEAADHDRSVRRGVLLGTVQGRAEPWIDRINSTRIMQYLIELADGLLPVVSGHWPSEVIELPDAN